MPATTSLPGMVVEFSMEHRNGAGQLIYRETSVMFPKLPPAPPEPTCFTVECINAYQRKFDIWAKQCKRMAEFIKVLNEYHHLRCQYCMTHRNDNINEKYRKGEPAPQNIDEARDEIKKLRRQNYVRTRASSLQ